jgi:hypothetical protein
VCVCGGGRDMGLGVIAWICGWGGDGDKKMEIIRLGCTDTYLKFQAHMSISSCDLKFSGNIPG